MTDVDNMVTETALVVDVEKDYAWVECVSRSACGQCHAADSCGNSAVAKAFAPKTHRFKVRLKHPVIPGQRIEIGLPAQSLVRSAMLVYLLPLVTMVIGVILAAVFFGSSNNIVLVGCIIGVLIGFLLARLGAKRLSRHREYEPVMLSISQ
ncbi:SoxR reducing system RseC family protein [Celerinatantimonas diazotrophica]|uniref:RseC/MucC-like positive regulator of sigma(E) n=1 Tax=Celerinatantimonas diazotrophica TaxID=412034 RepID=A0A4R1J981_9GAMM|nr:SoxR reducing system RseC family protein [Celerinatantimonas diazotrophica]TCK47146.1 RseC/MucC-like positive regulator of sigma(E) [Celerinatantimonas diazotrophica]CAG9295918.1 Protein RseC [Celerinatantimonas diazotrophica]